MNQKNRFKGQWIVGSIFLLPIIFYVLLSLGKHSYNRLSYYNTENEIVKIQEAKILTPGKLSTFQTIPTEKIVLWHVVNTNDFLLTPAIIANMQFLQDKFSDRKEVYFNSLIINEVNSDEISNFVKTLNIKTDNWNLLSGNSTQVKDFIQNDLGISLRLLPDSLQQVVPTQYVTLTDSNGHIRGYFDGATHKEVKGELLDAIDMLIREQYVKYKDSK